MRDSREKQLTTALLRVDGIEPGSGLGKHQKMATSPFVFFRGSAQVFYLDLASANVPIPEEVYKLPLTAVMGDCHTSNFGFLTEEGSHSDNVIFSPNDFDDACIGHAGWDLLRYLTSLILCAEHCQRLASGLLETNEFEGKACVEEKHVVGAMAQFLDGYLSVCEMGLTDDTHLQSVLAFPHKHSALYKPYQKAKARSAGGDAFLLKSQLAKSIVYQNGGVSFKTRADKFEPLEAKEQETLKEAFAPYMDDHVHQVVRRLNAGTGSVNMDRFYFLVGPGDISSAETLQQCHIVEVKQQREAAPLHYFKGLSPINRLNPAHLTVACQRRMQRRPDLVLDEVIWQDTHWLVRSRHHAKVGFNPEDLGLGKRNVEKGGFVEYAHVCGKALALAHCRTNRRSNAFERSVHQRLPACRSALTEAAHICAQQVIRDANWLRELEI